MGVSEFQDNLVMQILFDYMLSKVLFFLRREMEKLLTESDEVKQLYIEMKASKDKAVESMEDLKSKYEIALKESKELQDQLSNMEEHVKQLQDHILQLTEGSIFKF